jgi:hypothetical protein
MMWVTVLGPNLRNQSHGSIHVHAARCGDIDRSQYSGVDRWTTETESRRQIVEDEYPPGDFEWSDGPDDRSYWDDVWFAPCLKDLPREVPS